MEKDITCHSMAWEMGWTALTSQIKTFTYHIPFKILPYNKPLPIACVKFSTARKKQYQ